MSMAMLPNAQRSGCCWTAVRSCGNSESGNSEQRTKPVRRRFPYDPRWSGEGMALLNDQNGLCNNLS
ncbi:hypothetical protein AVEN_19933-1, partial [Araneus ventricosus]